MFGFQSYLWVFCWRWLMVRNLLHWSRMMKIRTGEGDYSNCYTSSSNNVEHYLIRQQDVLHLSQEYPHMTLWTWKVPMPKKWSHAKTGIVICPPLPNSRNLAGALTPPLLKYQKPALNISFESDHESTQALLLSMSSADQNFQQPNACGDDNDSKPQEALFEVTMRFIQAIVLMKTPWPLISDEKIWIGGTSWILAIEAQNLQYTFAGTPVGTLSLFQFPGGIFLNIGLETWESVSVEFCGIRLCQTYVIHCTPTFTKLKLRIGIIQGWFGDGACWTGVLGYKFNLLSETEK